MASGIVSSLSTTIVAGGVGVVVAVVAAVGIVSSQQSAGDSPVKTESVSYDGS